LSQAKTWLIETDGLAGELGVKKFTEQSLVATDLLTYLPEAIRACRDVPDEF